MDMFRDDVTGQISLGRVSSALILVCLLITSKTVTDIPTNWLYAMMTFYGVNKLTSTAKEIKANVGNTAVEQP